MRSASRSLQTPAKAKSFFLSLLLFGSGVRMAAGFLTMVSFRWLLTIFSLHESPLRAGARRAPLQQILLLGAFLLRGRFGEGGLAPGDVRIAFGRRIAGGGGRWKGRATVTGGGAAGTLAADERRSAQMPQPRPGRRAARAAR